MVSGERKTRKQFPVLSLYEILIETDTFFTKVFTGAFRLFFIKNLKVK